MTTPAPNPTPPNPDPNPPAPDNDDDAAYQKFAGFMDRYVADKAEKEKNAPKRTEKPKGFLDTFLGM